MPIHPKKLLIEKVIDLLVTAHRYVGRAVGAGAIVLGSHVIAGGAQRLISSSVPTLIYPFQELGLLSSCMVCTISECVSVPSAYPILSVHVE